MRIAVNETRLFIDVDGLGHPLEGARLGERPTLIVVHGGPGMDHSLLKPLFLPCAEEAQVIWVDLRGHGRSDPAAPEEWTLAQWADDLNALVEALDLDAPVLAGASIGGTAAALAAARSGRIGALVLTSTPVGHRLEAMLAVFERLGGAEARAVAERHWERPDAEAAERYRRVCLPLYAREPLPPEVMSRALLRPEIAPRFYAAEEWRTFDLCSVAPAIRCPTLVVSGTDDPVAPHAVARELVAALPRGLGRLVTVPNGRHVLFCDAPETVRGVALEFVREWWTERGEVAA